MDDHGRTIDTARLTLRVHARGDFEDSAAMWGDPEVTRHIGGRPFTREEAWARLLRYVGHWAVMEYGYFVARDRATGRFVGEVGLADFKRVMEPPLGDTPEMGWALATWAHGRGLATEAVQGVLDWLARTRGAVETACIIDVGNAASLRVAAKCGYAPAGTATYKGEPLLVFRHPGAPTPRASA
jgi:RimJ/RimL family protein N-acetyltransferase